MNLHLSQCKNVIGRTNKSKNTAAQWTVSVTELRIKATEKNKCVLVRRAYLELQLRRNLLPLLNIWLIFIHSDKKLYPGSKASVSKVAE